MRRSLPWAFLLAALALTALASALLLRSDRARGADTFQNAVQATRDRIEGRVLVYVALLHSAAGYVVTADGEPPPEDFRAYIGRLSVVRRYPGIQGIGYSRWLSSEAVRARVAAAWDEMGLEVKPWPDSLAPGAERHTIALLEPLDTRNRAALGYNMHNEPVRRAAMDRARATGEAAASGRVTLVQETRGPRQAGFLLYLPVYQTGVPPPTPALRHERLLGFVYAPFRADDLLHGIFGSEKAPRVAFQIYDGAPGEASLLHDSRTGGIAPAEASTLRDTSTFEVAGRTWTLVAAPTEVLVDEMDPSVPHALLLSGVGVGLLLFGLSFAQQRAAARLQARERELDTMVHALPQLVWRATPDGTVVWTNERWQAYTGLSAAALARPDAWTAALDADTRARVAQDVARAREDGKGWEGLVRLYPAAEQEPRWFWSQVVPIRDGEGRIVRWFGAHTDVTEQQHAREAEARALREQLAREAAEARERELQAHMQQLERSNRELEAFAHVASHDLQEPLRKIQTFSSLVRQDAGEALPPEAAHSLSRVEAAAARMSRLIKDLLDLSRVEHEDDLREQVPLEDVLEDVRRDLYVRIEETGATVEAGPLPTVHAVRMQMHQVLLNLVGNAVKFHRPGVPPHVRVSAMPITLPRAAGAVPAVRLSVEDNGLGFDEKHLGRIFSPFQRLHPTGTYDGTGIGLSLARRIVERHGGHITARSTPGTGTTFVVDLPLGTDAPTPFGLLPPPPAAAGHAMDERAVDEHGADGAGRAALKDASTDGAGSGAPDAAPKAGTASGA